MLLFGGCAVVVLASAIVGVVLLVVSRLAPTSATLPAPSGSSARRGATVTAANGAKAFPSKRPWMISH